MLLFDQRMLALTIIAKPNQAKTSKYELFVAKSETSHVFNPTSSVEMAYRQPSTVLTYSPKAGNNFQIKSHPTNISYCTWAFLWIALLGEEFWSTPRAVFATKLG